MHKYTMAILLGAMGAAARADEGQVAEIKICLSCPKQVKRVGFFCCDECRDAYRASAHLIEAQEKKMRQEAKQKRKEEYLAKCRGIK